MYGWTRRSLFPYFCLILIVAEAYICLIKDTACSSHPCEWLSPNFKNVNYAPICNIDFSAPTAKRKRIFYEGKENESLFLNSSNCVKIAPPASKDELEAFYNVLSKTGKPAIYSWLQ